MSETTTYAVGDRILFEGKAGTVWADGVVLLDEPDTLRGWGEESRKRFIYDDSTQPLTEGPQEAATAPQDTAEVSTLRAQLSTLQSQISRMQDDVATIGEHLKRTAERHEWCGEYEEHLGRLLEDLSEHTADTLKAAATRETEYDVTISVRVTARNHGQAEGRAADMYSQGLVNWEAVEA